MRIWRDIRGFSLKVPAELQTQAPPTKDEVLTAKKTIERILCENIFPFWYPSTIDSTDGGYRLNHDVDGCWRGPANKQLLAQARMLYFFARLANSPYGSPECLEAAHHGYEFLRRKLWDHQFGGFYWETDSLGDTATKPNKHLCGQAYGLFAVSEYFRASGNPSAKQLCTDVFELCETYAHDVRYGGYQEFFGPDWHHAACGNGHGYMGTPATTKLAATHLHWLEALTTYIRISDNPLVRERLTELILVLATVMANKVLGVTSDKYTRQWIPLDDAGRVSFGHHLKIIWMLAAGCEAANRPNGPLLYLYQRLFQQTLEYAFDRARGGFYNIGTFGRRIKRGDKAWWVQAEGLMCALTMYRLTMQKIYWNHFAKTLGWIATCQVDWEHGDWHRDVGEGGRPAGDKAGEWKAAYHNGRAMIESLRFLEALLSEIAAPTELCSLSLRNSEKGA